MADYLVTGVAGFIGSHVAAALLKVGHAVTGVDNLSTGLASKIPPGTDFFQADCHDPHLYQALLAGRSHDAIFHLAGQSSGEISFDDPIYDLRANTESTVHLLRYALGSGCRRFIYASSMGVYGIQPNEAVQENAPLQPQSFYGISKLAAEHYLRLHEDYGLSSTALRLFNVYGPGQNMHNLRQGMVSIFMAMMHHSGHIHVKGNPNRYRDFVYIDDVTDAFLNCLRYPQAGGACINIGSGERTAVGDLIQLICELSPKPVTVEYSGSTAGDVHGIYADIAAAAKLLAFEPAVSLKEGLQKMYAWYQSQ